jgi:hypothetical protein
MRTIEEILEDSKTINLEPIKSLFIEASNYPYPTPLTFFLDLIGYSKEELGENLTTLEEMQDKLGYHEIGLLGEGLVAYSDRPQETINLLEELLEAEREDLQ